MEGGSQGVCCMAQAISSLRVRFAYRLARYNKQITIASREISTAVRLPMLMLQGKQYYTIFAQAGKWLSIARENHATS
jgi:hypothetical protein